MRSWFVLALLAIVLLVALSTGYTMLFRLAYALALVLVISYLWSWLGVRRLRVERSARADRTEVGRTFEERLTVYNEGALPKLWLEVRDGSDMPGHNASLVVSLASHQHRTWRLRTLCRRRGRFQLGPIELISGDPLGLFQHRRVVGESTSLIVYPTMVDVSEFELPAGDLPGDPRLHLRTPNITPSAAGVREYASGDAFSRIHWPTTARVGKLMVKEFELDPTSDVWVVLDLDASVQAGHAPESTEEYAVTIAASLTRRFLEANRSVGLIALGGHAEVLPADRGERQLLHVLESLAVVRATGTRPLAEVLSAESVRFGRNATLVVITPSTATDWVSGLQLLLQRGIRTAVILVEASTFGPTATASGGLHVVSSLAAAEIITHLVKQGEPIGPALASKEVSARTRNLRP
jgi:uncharacterized protein (DUF58 family)